MDLRFARFSPHLQRSFWKGAIVLLLLAVSDLTWASAQGRAAGLHTANLDAPPEGEFGPEKNRPPWREPVPTLMDVSLPDLQTLPPFDLQLVVNSWARTRKIRFSNSVWNSGEGVLEMRGEADPRRNTMVTTQYLYGFDQDQVKRRVGEFEYHPVHNHWHWEGFSVYEIRSVGPDWEAGEMLATSGKVGFCMMDIDPIDEVVTGEDSISDIAISARPQYGQCHWRRQGISPGWVDTYHADIPGQEIDISHLRDGLYALISIADPDGLIYEATEENNSAVVFFILRGNDLFIPPQ